MRVALLCIAGLIAVGVTQAEDLQVRFLDGNGAVITNRNIGVIDNNTNVVLQKILGQPNGVYVITNPAAGKLQFVLTDMITGNVTQAQGMVPVDFAPGTIIDIPTTAAPVNPLQAPVNDDCVNAIGPLAVPSLTAGTTVGAAPEPGTIPSCGSATMSGAPGVWYTALGTGNTMNANTCVTDPNPGSSTYDTKIGIYCFDCAAPTCVAGNDDGLGCPSFQSVITWGSQIGQTYRILVHGFSTSFGDFELSLSDDGVAASADVNCIPSGACCNCLPSPFNCTVETAAGCADLAGTFQGDFSECITPFGLPTAHSSDAGGAPISVTIGTTSNTLTIGPVDDCIVADVDVAVNLFHTFMGDLVLSVAHGPSLILIDSQCGATGGGIHSTANDEGTDLSCLGIANGPTADVHYPPAIGGRGDGFLSIFDGGQSGGDWTISVLDQFAGDDGTLDSWSIIFDCGTPICVAAAGKEDDSSSSDSASSDDQFDGRPFGTVHAAGSRAGASEFASTDQSQTGNNDDAAATTRAPRTRKLRTRGE
jgi:subtilisin-like proprotein convertase family protein